MMYFRASGTHTVQWQLVEEKYGPEPMHLLKVQNKPSAGSSKHVKVRFLMAIKT